ncbi:MAG: MarR family transcriptional regulator [Halanaerobiaceae bacterium]|nr:MarR family transcriptional regulator [Halanaerobiaceae bacterium]
MDHEGLYNLFLENIRKLLYPQDWIELDLSFSKSELLTLLFADRYEDIIMSQIAEYLKVSMSTATGFAERLVNKGYLQRSRSDTDRRIVIIKLTEKGKRLVNEIKEIADYYFRKITDSLTEEEKELLGKVFLRIIELLNDTTRKEQETESEENKIRKIEIE